MLPVTLIGVDHLNLRRRYKPLVCPISQSLFLKSLQLTYTWCEKGFDTRFATPHRTDLLASGTSRSSFVAHTYLHQKVRSCKQARGPACQRNHLPTLVILIILYSRINRPKIRGLVSLFGQSHLQKLLNTMGTREGTKGTMKRSRRVFTTAFVVLATVMVELDGSSAFSPASDVRATSNVDRRRNNRGSNPGARDEDSSSHRTGSTGTDLNVAMAPSLLNVFPKSNIAKIKNTISVSSIREQLQLKAPTEIVSLPPSSRAVSLGKRNRSTRMVRPKTRISSPQLDGNGMPSDHSGLLDKAQEGKLTVSIRSLRRAIRIRDQIVESSDSIPSEAEWAKACDLSVLGLRRVMYEGQQARTVLVSANVGLVTSIAKRHFAALKQATAAGGGVGTILTMQDLIQEGNLGLMQAAERFEAERGHRFSTYATYWIKQRIMRSISDSSRIIRLPAHGEFLLTSAMNIFNFRSFFSIITFF